MKCCFPFLLRRCSSPGPNLSEFCGIFFFAFSEEFWGIWEILVEREFWVRTLRCAPLLRFAPPHFLPARSVPPLLRCFSEAVQQRRDRAGGKKVGAASFLRGKIVKDGPPAARELRAAKKSRLRPHRRTFAGQFFCSRCSSREMWQGGAGLQDRARSAMTVRKRSLRSSGALPAASAIFALLCFASLPPPSSHGLHDRAQFGLSHRPHPPNRPRRTFFPILVFWSFVFEGQK